MVLTVLWSRSCGLAFRPSVDPWQWGLCGVVWGCAGLCGVVWGCVGLCGVVWGLVELCGAL